MHKKSVLGRKTSSAFDNSIKKFELTNKGVE